MNNLYLVAIFVVVGGVLGLIGAPLFIQQSTPPKPITPAPPKLIAPAPPKLIAPAPPKPITPAPPITITLAPPKPITLAPPITIIPAPPITITPAPPITPITPTPPVSLIPEEFGQELDLNEIYELEKHGVPVEHYAKLLEFMKCKDTDVISSSDAGSMLKKLRDGDSVETGCTSAPVSSKTTATTPTLPPKSIEDPTPTPLPIPSRVDTSAEGDRDFYLILKPSGAVPGQEVVLTGSRASYNGNISRISVSSILVESLSNGSPVSTIATDSSGNFTASFAIPNTYATQTPGSFTINVLDNEGNVGEVTLKILPRVVEMSTNSSGRGSRITMAGSGFSSDDDIRIHYRTDQQDQQVGTARATSYGSWQAEFKVPSTPAIPSRNTVVISGSNGNTNTLVHSIPGANIWMSPASAESGSSITVSGSSFPGFVLVKKITIGLGRLEITPSPHPSTDGYGSFSATVSLPMLPAGHHPIWVEINNVDAVGTILLK